MTLTHTAQLLARSTRAVLIAVFWAGFFTLVLAQHLNQHVFGWWGMDYHWNGKQAEERREMERERMLNERITKRLNGIKAGRFALTADEHGVVLYDPSNRGDENDQRIVTTVDELIDICRKIVAIAEAAE